MFLSWSSGHMQLDESVPTAIDLPKLVTIPRCYHHRLQTMLNVSYHARLLYGTHGIYTPITQAPIPERDEAV